jgi:signal peptidase I
MTNDNYNPSEPPKVYRPWVGVVLSFFISGASHFLSGRRIVGISWFVGIWLLKLLAGVCFASPLFPGDGFAIGLLIVAFVAWIVMLVQSYKVVPRFSGPRWLVFIILFFLLSYCSFLGTRAFIMPFRMPTSSMSPTIRGDATGAEEATHDGDHIFVECYAYWFGKPQRGDIIVFWTAGIPDDQRKKYFIRPNEFYVKRIAGVPGDVISIQDGHLCNNGQLISQPQGLAGLKFPVQLAASTPYLNNPMTNYKVHNGSYFVVGDNTTNSLDSRYYGAIDGGSIIGKVSKIYWPYDRVGAIQ